MAKAKTAKKKTSGASKGPAKKSKTKKTKAAGKGAGGAKKKPSKAPKKPAKASLKAKKAPSKKPKATAAKPKPAADLKPAPKPKPPPKVFKPVKMKWGKASLAAIKEKLEIERDELGKELKEIEEAAFAASQSEISGEVGYDEDYADAGSATFEREKDLSIYNNVLDLLEKVNKALRKIDDGWYGVCESCGKPITKPRLKALPSVLLCLECKKSEERR